MDRLYFFLLGVVLLAFLLNIVIVTRSHYPGSEVGVAPVVQLVLAGPLFLLSAAVLFLTRDLGMHSRQWILLLPLVLQVLYFGYTRDLFALFSQGSGGFLIRSYLGAMAASTAVGYVVAWASGTLAA